MSQDNQSITLLALFRQKGLGVARLFLKHSALFIFLAFLSLTLGFYFPTIKAGFVTDVTSGIERIQGQPFRNIIYSFGFPALNQISILGFYLLYTIFGINGWAWYLVFCTLHATNAFLSFSLFRRLFQYFKIKEATIISLVGALLFLLSPYQTEVLVWRACLNYLLVTAFILGSLFYLVRYLETKKQQYFWGTHGFFILSLFTFELSLILPFLTIIFYVSWLWTTEYRRYAKFSKFNKAQNSSILAATRFSQSEEVDQPTKGPYELLRYFINISLPQFALLGSYFLLNKWLFGRWIGHYGAATHLKFSLTTMSNTLLKYSLKYLFFVRSYSHPYKTAVFNFCDQYGFIILCLVLISVIFFVKNKQINTKKTTISLLLIATFTLTLLPVLNLYFYWLQAIENDRYGYLPAVFGLMLFVFCCFQLPKYFRYFLLSSYLVVSIFLLVKTNQIWKESTTVFYSLLEDYRWEDVENVVILNVPDNYQGAYLFRIIGRKSGFQDALTYIQQKEVKGKIWEVTQYNMARPTDGVSVASKKPDQLKVTFNQWGNWFWRNGIGAGATHQRSIYTAHFKGQYYVLALKKTPVNTIYIYQDGKEWKVFE